MPTKPISPKEALLKLSAMCSRSEHSTGEMRDKLRRWNIDDSEADAIVTRLIEEHFVDDERFARFYTRDKMRFDKWGRRKIRQGLYTKGVDSNTTDKVLSEIPDADFAAILKPLLASRRRSVKATTPYELNAKLMRFAMSRGFESDVIRQCLDTSNTPDVCEEADLF